MVECEVKYKVFDLTGEKAISPDEGQLLSNQIKTTLDAGQTVELDFAGLTLASASFLNEAFSDLYEYFTPEEIDRRIMVTNAAPLVEDVLELVKDWWTRYYSFDETTRLAVENAIARRMFVE